MGIYHFQSKLLTSNYLTIPIDGNYNNYSSSFGGGGGGGGFMPGETNSPAGGKVYT